MTKTKRVHSQNCLNQRSKGSHKRLHPKPPFAFHAPIYGKLRGKIGGIIRDLCRQKGLDLLEGHAMKDHVHLCLSIPPKFSVSNTVGFLKGKSAIRIHRELLGTKKMSGLSFWAKGYCASTVGLDEEVIKKYIREQDNKH